MSGLSYNYSTKDFVLIRYNIDGSIDASFEKKIVPVGNNVINTMAMQADGKIVVGGINYSYDENNGPNTDYAFARFNTDGTFDTGFGNDGIAIFDVEKDDVIKSLVIQRNGKIIGGGMSNNTISLVRVKTNGTLDSSFNGNGIQLTHASTSLNAIRGMAIYSNKLYAAGYGLFPGNFGLALRYELDDTLLAPVVNITAPGKDTIYSGPARIKLKAAATHEMVT